MRLQLRLRPLQRGAQEFLRAAVGDRGDLADLQTEAEAKVKDVLVAARELAQESPDGQLFSVRWRVEDRDEGLIDRHEGDPQLPSEIRAEAVIQRPLDVLSRIADRVPVLEVRQHRRLHQILRILLRDGVLVHGDAEETRVESAVEVFGVVHCS